MLAPMLTARRAASIDDLRVATDLMSRAWLAGSPFVAATPAAIEWWYVVSADPLDAHLRLWDLDGTTVAWSWEEDGELEWHAWTGEPARDAAVFREIVSRTLANQPAATLGTWTAADDAAATAVLVELGFRPEGRRLSQWVWRAADGPPAPPTLPDGYRIRGLHGPDEFSARVDLHRRAFPTSRLTSTRYARVGEVPHYQWEDDLVVEAPDGSLAAFALGWWDPIGRVAEFEPVGTDPDHQRQGLARALLAHGLRRFLDRGATTVQVYSDASSPAAEALYAAVGFRRRAFHQRYEHARRGTIDAMTDTTPDRDAATRIERDSMGEMAVPTDALYGASTQRAVENFPISGQRFPRAFIRALALVKLAAAETNGALGLLPEPVARAIASAAATVADGDHDDQFPIDIYQTGSGTSTNTNMNEVVAHLASARLASSATSGPRPTRGKARTFPTVHPNDDVNRCQSSNDTIPTALQLAAAIAIEERLIPALVDLQDALADRAEAFWPVVKTGRTHLQDATPIRLGQEFQGYAGQVEASIRRVQAARDELLTVPLGGTAVGTGINAHPEFAARTCARLTELTGLLVVETPNHFAAQASLDVPIAAHGAIRTTALALWKIASDIRLLGMGPRAGLAELAIPETQPGSSIMPGKVNPVIVESLTMVVARVVGNDATVAFGQTGSFLELNVMLPVTAVALLESIELLAAAARNFAGRTVRGLSATERGPQLVEQGLMLATALAPVIGYDDAAKLAKEAYRTGRTIRELALERGMAADELDRLLDPAAMTEPGLGGGTAGG